MVRRMCDYKYMYEKVYEHIPEGKWLFPSQIKEKIQEETRLEFSKEQIGSSILRLTEKGKLETQKIGKTKRYKKEVIR